MEEDAVIERRLLARETQGLKLCTKRYIQLKRLLCERPREESLQCSNALLRELLVFEQNGNKAQVIAETQELEVMDVDARKQQTEETIDRVSEEIRVLRVKLEHERLIRRNKEEYDAIARTILQLPSRKDTEREIQRLNGDVEVLEERSRTLQRRRELRARHFALLLHTVEELQHNLEEERRREKEEDRSGGHRVDEEDVGATTVAAVITTTNAQDVEMVETS